MVKTRKHPIIPMSTHAVTRHKDENLEANSYFFRPGLKRKRRCTCWAERMKRTPAKEESILGCREDGTTMSAARAERLVACCGGPESERDGQRGLSPPPLLPVWLWSFVSLSIPKPALLGEIALVAHYFCTCWILVINFLCSVRNLQVMSPRHFPHFSYKAPFVYWRIWHL